MKKLTDEDLLEIMETNLDYNNAVLGINPKYWIGTCISSAKDKK